MVDRAEGDGFRTPIGLIWRHWRCNAIHHRSNAKKVRPQNDTESFCHRHGYPHRTTDPTVGGSLASFRTEHDVENKLVIPEETTFLGLLHVNHGSRVGFLHPTSFPAILRSRYRLKLHARSPSS